MKISALVTLLLTVITITADAIPIVKRSVSISLKKNGPSDLLKWTQVRNIHRNRASVKYGFNIQSENKFALRRSTSKTISERAANSSTIDLVNQSNNDVGYFGPIDIDGQTFNVIFDTGSSDLWVPGQGCKSLACTSHTNFIINNTGTSFINDKTPFNITYGSGSVSGTSARATVSIGGNKALNQTFGLTSFESDEFISAEFDGIMGMGLDSLSNQQRPTPFSTMVNQKNVPNSFFGFHLSRAKDSGDVGTLTLGDVDKNKFAGSIAFNKVTPNLGFWLIKMDDALSDDKALGFKNRSAIIDTGTSLMIIPNDDAKAIHDKIKGSKVVQGEYIVPCNTTAKISLQFGGIKYNIDSRDLAFQSIDKTNIDCVSGIANGSIGKNNDVWLVGDTFLKNVYSVYDIKKSVVGFAPSVKAK